MSPPGCCRGESEIRNQWARHVATQPSSFSILKTPGNSQQLPCLNGTLSEEAPCPQELSCIKLSAQCLSTLHHSYVLFPCLHYWGNALQVPDTSSHPRGRMPSSASSHHPAHTSHPGSTALLHRCWPTDLCTALLAEGTFSGGSNRTLHTHCLESKASGQPS